MELSIYIEQISASIGCLWASYGIYFPTERNTLRQIAIQANGLIQLYGTLQKDPKNADTILVQKKKNAIISALVEISAALSYAVTQGTSGTLPVLSSRSPFPHHSLFGIGGAVRALTKYTRYIETAFVSRSAISVIDGQYSKLKHSVPACLPDYKSGPEYSYEDRINKTEHFDDGGNLPQENHVPLIVHFSLRHGFMESKYSVTAASEALTAGTLPAWTLMTLSHEIMHSRVRAIFQALFGKQWDGKNGDVVSGARFSEYSAWLEARYSKKKAKVVSNLRNVVLDFCWALEL